MDSLAVGVFYRSDVYENTIIMDSSYPINKNIARKERVTPVTIGCKGTAAVCKSTVTKPVQSSLVTQPSHTDPDDFAVALLARDEFQLSKA